MKLIFKNDFSEATKYYLEKNEHETKTLLSKMKALESYPPINGNLIANSREYMHAEKKLNELRNQKQNLRIVCFIIIKNIYIYLKNNN